MSANETSRRDFIRVTALAGGGFVLGVRLPARERLAAMAAAESAESLAAAPFAPNAWIRIAGDGIVTIVVDKSEMGQGVNTSLPMLVAEELEADWNRIRIEHAPVGPEYNNTLFGMQATGGSSSIASSLKSLRTAGAAAREMLVAAAAQRWNVDASTLAARNGEVVHSASGRRASYGELAEAAAGLPVPKEPRLKDAKDFRIIGRRVKRLDTPLKVNGTATFGMDVKVPGLLVAVVARPPVVGGTLARLDDTKARAVPGVKHVVQIARGVAVVGEGYWPASQGRRALAVTWADGEGAAHSTAAMRKAYRAAAKGPAIEARNDGDAVAAISGAKKRIEAEFEAPLLAHAPMEPLNCTAHVRADGCDIWAPTQRQDETRAVAARITGLAPEKIAVRTTYLGGGFGRKFETDFIEEAVETSKKVGAPVKVIWSREDDMQHDCYRPAAYNHLSAALDADGWPVAWRSTVVSGSTYARVFPAMLPKSGLDGDAIEGAANIPYAIPNVHVGYVRAEPGVNIGFWRSVGSSQNAFFTECFVDELAQAGGKDPLELRRRLLASSPRLLGVLNLVAEKAAWGSPLPKGRARGLAVHSCFGTFVAEVAEVSIAAGNVRVHRVVCAVDCGQVVNPDTVEAQISGGVVFGLTAALKGEITIDRGRVKQSNFHDYPMLRLSEMPAIEVHIVPSTEAPTGVGEPGTPPIAPAVANAVSKLTGTRVRSLPIRLANVLQAGTVKKK